MKLQVIADIGRSLKIALDMTKCSPGSMGQGVAWERAETVQPLPDTVGQRMLKIKRG